MHTFNRLRSKIHHESSHPSRTTPASLSTKLTTHFIPSATADSANTTPTQSISISAPIINSKDKVIIIDKDQTNKSRNEEQISVVDDDNIEEQLISSEETEKMSGECTHLDDQPVSSTSTLSNSSSSSIQNIEVTSIMVGASTREEVLTNCKATAMIYNDAQKKWIHCASNGPAKIQILFTPDTQTYRIVGRQIQDHEVVLNHLINKGIKYNQATPTFHQWRDQSSVYGLNFASKLDAQEFGTTMTKILESVNGSTNLSSHTNTNGGVTLPSSTQQNNNNTNSTSTYKRQTSQPSTISFPPTATTVSINSTSSPSVTVFDPTQQQQQHPPHPQQQQQLHSSSSYNNQLRPSLNSINSTLTGPSNNNNNSNHHHTTQHTQHQQPPEEEETNYALISDSLSSYGDNLNNKNNNIPQAPPLNLSMSTGSAPPPAPPPPPPAAPPPPPPMPSNLGAGQPSAPSLVLPTSNGSNGTSTPRKSSTTAPPMDLMSEMAAKFAQRRKQVDEGEKPDSSNVTNSVKASSKTVPTSTLPPTPVAPLQTSPRINRKMSESQTGPHITANDLEKLKTDILTEIRKDIEKAKQEILTALVDRQKTIRK
ncbi:unnamed protein product [Adineta ricciae]|uniref:WH1 domain-containing protein n=3 Tax=Adineta ricciae TaxID=249248 RepID=A0A814TXW5_ADIRI|nr:unnamed protein product [Adineta ricciae]